jgi:hypothetical protein
MISRRELIGKAAVGATAAAALTAGAALTGVASARTLPGGTTDVVDRNERNDAHSTDDGAITSPPPWELLSPLAAGSEVAHGWRVTDLSPVQDGACVVTLQNARGRAHRLHVCRNDGTPQGIVYTRRVDLVVMNEGKGDLPTEEHLAQAIAALAHVIAANEARLSEHVVAELLPHAERVRRFAAVEAPLAGGKLR